MVKWSVKTNVLRPLSAVVIKELTQSPDDEGRDVEFYSPFNQLTWLLDQENFIGFLLLSAK